MVNNRDECEASFDAMIKNAKLFGWIREVGQSVLAHIESQSEKHEQ